MENLSPVIQIMLLDAKYYLSEDILTKVDRASMHVALEAREPLLDQKIIDFIAPLPIEFKIRRNKGKYLMRKLLEKNLPKNLWQRPKHGFAIPQEEWLRKKIDKMVKSYLSVEKINKYKILNSEHVNNILDRFYKRNEKGLSNKIWLLFIFQLWAERWLD
jgi:asparagine synthase (glutamine-hydrolysing)